MLIVAIAGNFARIKYKFFIMDNIKDPDIFFLKSSASAIVIGATFGLLSSIHRGIFGTPLGNKLASNIFKRVCLVGITYGTAMWTYLNLNSRKDDYRGRFIGGLTAGVPIGIITKNMNHAFSSSICLGLLSLFFKFTEQSIRNEHSFDIVKHLNPIYRKDIERMLEENDKDLFNHR